MSIDINEELREACCQGDLDHVQKLIKAGAAVNSRNKVNGWTALHWACKRNHEQVVAMLLGAGANPSVLNEKGEQAVTLTSSSKIRHLLQLTEEGIPFSERARYSNAKGTTSSDGENSPGFVPNYLRFPSFPYANKEVPAQVTPGGDHDVKRASRRSHHGPIAAPPPPPPPQRHHSHPSGVAPRNGHEAPVAVVAVPGVDVPAQFSSHPPQPIRIARANLVTRSTQTGHGSASGGAAGGGGGGSGGEEAAALILKVRLAECSRSDKSDADFYEVELERSKPVTLERLLCAVSRELEVQPGRVRRIRKLPDVVVRKDADARRLVDGQHLEVVLL